MGNRSEYMDNQLTPQNPTANLWLRPFYSKSQSFIKLRRCSITFRCNRKAVIRAQYMIHSTISPHQETINFFYMVGFTFTITLKHGNVKKSDVFMSIIENQYLFKDPCNEGSQV